MSDLRSRYDEHFSKRVESFVQTVGEINATGVPEAHLPLYGTGYEESLLKIGFIGVDTNGWGDKTTFMNAFIEAVKSDPKKAIHRYEEDFNELQFTGWTNNFGTAFWDMAFRLLAGLYDIPDWKTLKRREPENILRSFFWANANSVELYRDTPSKNKVPKDVWRRLKDASEKHLDSFETLIEVFLPDVVVIMNWEPSGHFMDVSLNWETLGDHLAFATHPAAKTQVFKTAHPTWLNQNDLYDPAVAEIIKKAKEDGLGNGSPRGA